jgi:hypothetical protein
LTCQNPKALIGVRQTRPRCQRAVPIVAGVDKGSAIGSAFALKIAAMAKISNRNSYVPAEDKVVGRIEREAR